MANFAINLSSDNVIIVKMARRKTTVFLVLHLFIDWVVWIILTIYWEDSLELSSWSLLLENRSVQEYIDILGPKWTNSRLSLFKKVDYCPQGLAPWGRLESPSPRTPSPCRSTLPLRTSAPPWTTLVVVLIILAWCHSFFEFNNSSQTCCWTCSHAP